MDVESNRSRVGPGQHQHRLILVLSVVVIAYFTLFPFDFHVQDDRSVLELASDFDVEFGESYVRSDMVRNLFLFVPLGFGLARSLSGRPRPFLLAVLGGAAVSALVELLQGYALVRNPAVPDVLANTVGCGAGAFVFVRRGDQPIVWVGRRVAQLRSSLTAWRVLAICLVSSMLFVTVSARTQSSTRLDNWDLTQSLSVGNETTGDRPWRGSMQAFYLFDQSISDSDLRLVMEEGPGALGASAVLVAHDDFTDGEVGVPALRWSSGAPLESARDGLRFDGQDWLRSPGSVAEVSRALVRSSEFTLGLDVATEDLAQGGPARLFSISDGIFVRNLTLGQDGSSLVLRLRTPLTGADGTDPEFTVSDVFTDGEMHQIVVRYDGSTVRVGIDGGSKPHVIQLVPEAAALLRTFPEDIERLRLSPVSTWVFRVLYRAPILLLFATAMAWFGRRVRAGRATSGIAVGMIAVGMIAVALALALEAALSSVIDRYDLRTDMVALDVTMIVLAASAFYWRSGENSRLPHGAWDPFGSLPP